MDKVYIVIKKINYFIFYLPPPHSNYEFLVLLLQARLMYIYTAQITLSQFLNGHMA